MRLAFVVPRYGPQIVGGAETLTRALAGALAERGHDVEVLATTATNHFTWAPEFPEGTSREDGALVRRFDPHHARDVRRFLEVQTRLSAGARLSYLDQLGWIGNSVWSPGILRHLEAHGDGYDWILLAPYLFGTTYWGAQVRPEASVLIPCLHDEPFAYQDVVREMLESVAGCLFNAPGEAMLAERLAHVGRSDIAGMGFVERPRDPEVEDRFLARHHLDAGFLFYAGRRETAKGVPRLIEAYRRYATVMGGDVPPLVLAGSGPVDVPRAIRRSVVDVGYLSEEEKWAAYRTSLAFVHPSRMESLSIVLMESWLAGSPVLVNAASVVMRDHCMRSGGGIPFDNAATFAEGVELLRHDPALRARMAAAGRAYVESTYSWDVVCGRVERALEHDFVRAA